MELCPAWHGLLPVSAYLLLCLCIFAASVSVAAWQHGQQLIDEMVLDYITWSAEWNLQQYIDMTW